jgi:N-acetylmuramoyl-L-alanine amidase
MSLKIVERPSPNHDARAEGPIDILVMHYTGMKTAEEALARLCDPEAKVSSHYTIDRDGTVYRHVTEDRRARHAGVSYWAGVRDVNSRSIGIEIVNPGHEFGYIPFAEPQIAALIDLGRSILTRHPTISPSRVVGHSDVAPNRKQDPGELFPWARLAEFGIGLWPSTHPLPSQGKGDGEGETFAENLRRFGYGVSPEIDWPLADVIAAFQRHFRPSCINGIPDAECEALLERLLAA